MNERLKTVLHIFAIVFLIIAVIAVSFTLSYYRISIIASGSRVSVQNIDFGGQLSVDVKSIRIGGCNEPIIVGATVNEEEDYRMVSEWRKDTVFAYGGIGVDDRIHLSGYCGSDNVTCSTIFTVNSLLEAGYLNNDLVFDLPNNCTIFVNVMWTRSEDE